MFQRLLFGAVAAVLAVAVAARLSIGVVPTVHAVVLIAAWTCWRVWKLWSHYQLRRTVARTPAREDDTGGREAIQAPQLNFWTGFLFAGALHGGLDALGGADGGATGFSPGGFDVGGGDGGGM